MSASPLHDIWEASASQPLEASIGKASQFYVGFALLLIGFFLTSLFGLNNTFKNVSLYGIPASLAFGFGAVYMICAVGVYV
ncbi:hypothetical protein BDY17DRAFT_250561 [Neohortaea acidophila]|uniref:Dolichyl-diphosphooligosaccharide-protein glycosyltransferase subunit OST5 n=1 Tax=Neohortaea acidophila TaxID=245834 RepID=A0A6A6PT10_9PEZI|nr:uncharacterized protein BDY17DRAFT_250561 [Neohortaea acidophila]KAF2483238.1 hypothetical protein BDY17DRAFT_250561 [Neohortaea acidophila]